MRNGGLLLRANGKKKEQLGIYMEKIKNTTMIINAVAKDLALNMTDERFRKDMYLTAAITTMYGCVACINTAAFVYALRT